MIRKLFVLLFVAAMFVPLSGTNATAAPRRIALNPTFTRVVELVNHHRAAAGLPRVTPNAILMAEAQRFSGVQAAMGRLSHRGTDGTTAGQRLTRAGYRWSFYGENLAAGQQTADAVVRAWMASPSHRANIMHPKVREIGLGHTFKSDGSSGYLNYWAMELGRPR